MATTTTQTQTTTQTTTQAVNIGSPSVVVNICPFGGLGASDGKKTTQAVKVGLFGSDSQGDFKDITEKTKEPPAWLKSVHIWSTDVQDKGVINAITFTIVDDKSFRCTLGPWGSVLDQGMLIDLEKTGGYITELSGYTDGENITSLTVVTNENNKKETYGPFGKPNPEDSGDTKFSIPLEKGAIVAFFGRSDGNCLKAIGAYVAAPAEPPPGEPAGGPSLRIQPGVYLDKKSSTWP